MATTTTTQAGPFVPTDSKRPAVRTLSVPAVGGRRFAFPPASTAVVLIDMQHDFVSPHGACGQADPRGTARLRAIVPRLARVLGAARRARLVVAHTRFGFAPDLSDLSELARRHSRDAGGEYGRPGPMGRILVRGEPGHAIVPELEPRGGVSSRDDDHAGDACHDDGIDSEIVVDKTTFGAFASTDLHARLERRGVTHLVFAGVTTSCCVESSLREAVDRGYFCCTLKDGCAAPTSKLHDATLRTIQSEAHIFGWIASIDDFVGALESSRAISKKRGTSSASSSSSSRHSSRELYVGRASLASTCWGAGVSSPLGGLSSPWHANDGGNNGVNAVGGGEPPVGCSLAITTRWRVGPGGTTTQRPTLQPASLDKKVSSSSYPSSSSSSRDPPEVDDSDGGRTFSSEH